MGCDIHLHTEIKIRGGWQHYSAPDTPRCYPLFTKMAGVRAYGDEEPEDQPIAKPRGIPEDISTVTRIDYDKWEDDRHSHSWLSADEIFELGMWLRKQNYKSDEYFDFLFGNHWESFADPEYRSQRVNMFPAELEDIRFVFWFDN